jgi:hypothetical protein
VLPFFLFGEAKKGKTFTFDKIQKKIALTIEQLIAQQVFYV